MNYLVNHLHHYHFSSAERLGGLYGPFEARPADVNVLCVAVLGQELQESADVQVVVIVNVAEPPGTHKTHGVRRRRFPRVHAL